MAEGQKIGGYQCEFVGPVPEELLCKSCKLVPKKLFTTDCCTERFCQACIEQPLNDKKPCPRCGEADFSTLPIKGAQKKILALQVRCAMKQKGCEWVGQLEQLDAHLDTDCQYVDVECPLNDDMNQETVRESAAEVTALKKQLQETDQNFSTLSTACLPTYHLTMANYAELKGKDTIWDSECFYTHPGGYQCFIGVWPNGWGEGLNHVSVLLYSEAGQFDGTLPWPAKVTFTLQLLNQHRDQDHWTVTKSFEWKKPEESDYACDFSQTFIPHTELGWNAGNKTKYLHEDCLRFRITRIQLHK